MPGRARSAASRAARVKRAALPRRNVPSSPCARLPSPRCASRAQAFAGVAATELLGLRVSSAEAFSDSNWFTAWQTFSIKNPGGAAQILLGCALVEGATFPEAFWDDAGDRAPGDLGFDPLGLSKGKSAADKATLELKELKNGRAAMIAIMALSSSKLVPGSVPLLP